MELCLIRVRSKIHAAEFILKREIGNLCCAKRAAKGKKIVFHSLNNKREKSSMPA